MHVQEYRGGLPERSVPFEGGISLVPRSAIGDAALSLTSSALLPAIQVLNSRCEIQWPLMLAVTSPYWSDLEVSHCIGIIATHSTYLSHRSAVADVRPFLRARRSICNITFDARSKIIPNRS
jgi:hypothetical protein